MDNRRNYSIRLSEEETEKFIKARMKLEYLFTAKIFDLKTSWEKVGLEAGMEEIDWRKLKKKWSNLMDKYKAIIEPPTGLGTPNGGPRAATWPHFELLHQYCSERHNINPPMLVDTAIDVPLTTSRINEPSPSTSSSINEPSTSSGRTRKRKRDEEEKQFKLLEKATKMYIKYMSTLVVLTESDESDSE